MLKLFTGISLIVVGLFASSIYDGLEVGAGAGYMKSSKSGKSHEHGIANVRINKDISYKNSIVRMEFEKGSKVKRALINYEYDMHTIDTYGRLKPYTYVGGGREWIKDRDDNDKHKKGQVADFGIGAKYKLDNNFNLFAEARALRGLTTNKRNHYGAIAGMNYVFGKSENKVIDKDNDGVPDYLDQCPNTPKDIKVDATGCALDTDKDGVPNYLDQCPNTPLGVKVNSKGCSLDADGDGVLDNLDKCPNTPRGMKVDKNGCALDSDHDGIPDAIDKCLNTPLGVKVDKNGCALDLDHDGVSDAIDRCPNTPLGVKVNENGCALDSDHDGIADYLDECPNTPQGIVTNKKGCPLTFNFNVHFARNSAKLTSFDLQKVKEFAYFLRRNPKYKAEIDGYTDNRGSTRHNIILSTKRARAVYNALIRFGISPKRLSYKGFGPFDPIASNKTEEGRRLNRRVVAKLFF
jgi:outer membrane protein OmpA-like peptidoglycan-associated protein